METPERGITRRSLLGTAAAGGAALAFGTGTAASGAPAATTGDGPWIEATFSDLQRLMQTRQLSSLELTNAYLERIDELDPVLHSVIETNPLALVIAAFRDLERRVGRVRGPLHGIPILIKDNIASLDLMQATAGSLALVGSRPPADAPLVSRLRAAGAMILGKANLSEWANFRGGRHGIPSTAGAPAAASRATRTSSTSTRAARPRARPSRLRRTCAPERWAPRPTGRSSARPATTSSSG